MCACLFQNPCDFKSSFPQIQMAMEGLWIWFSLTRTVPPYYSGPVTTWPVLTELPWTHFTSSVFLTFLGRRGRCFCTPYLLSFICAWGMQGCVCVWPEVKHRCHSSGASHLIFKDRSCLSVGLIEHAIDWLACKPWGAICLFRPL